MENSTEQGNKAKHAHAVNEGINTFLLIIKPKSMREKIQEVPENSMGAAES